MRWFLAIVAAVSPQRVKHFIYRRVFGWDVHPTARFGFSLIAVGHLNAAEGVIVSHLNVIKGCDEVHLGVGALVGPMNWVSSPVRGIMPSSDLFPGSPERRPHFVLGDAASITSRHILYCADAIVIEPYAILGGLRSQIVTHGPDYLTAQQRTAPVRIGHHSIVATNCTLLAGSSIPPNCIVAAGATVPGPLYEEFALYGGVPARKLKKLPADAALFHRERGHFE